MSSTKKYIALSVFLFVLQGCLTHSLTNNDLGKSKCKTDFVCYLKPNMYSSKQDVEIDFVESLPKDSLELCVVLDTTVGQVKNVSLFSSVNDVFSYQLKKMPGVTFYAYCKMISPESQMSSPLLYISTTKGEYSIPIIPHYAVMNVFLKKGMINVHYGCIFSGGLE